MQPAELEAKVNNFYQASAMHGRKRPRARPHLTRVKVTVSPTVIVEVQLSPQVLKWFVDRYHVRDISDPVEMGLAVMRLLKEDAKRAKAKEEPQLQQS